MTDILLCGCNGRMGQVITRIASGREDLKIVAGCDINDISKSGYPVFKEIGNCNVKADVIVDFSNPEALIGTLEYAAARKLPIVVATTGLSQQHQKLLENTAKTVPVFYSVNMSLGVNLLIDLVKKAARILSDHFDIEIIEKHHNQKLDAPSGTALVIADAINGALKEKHEYIYDRHSRRKKRSKTEIGIHAVRGGTIVGEHSVIFAGNDEIIEINHSAMSRDIFGQGALHAANFIIGKKSGMYCMNDIIGE